MSLAVEWREGAAFNERRGSAIDILLLHYTGMATAEAALRRLTDSASGVSCHYLVDLDGRVFAMVPEEKRAWHAGLSAWAGAQDINSRSIGIEVHNRGHDDGYPDFPECQIAAVIALCRDVLTRHPMPAPRILAHSDVAPERKIDPGEKFAWKTLARAGIGLWVEPAPLDTPGGILEPGSEGASVRVMQEQLARYGYAIAADGCYGPQSLAVITAFQRHFRPQRVDGIADASTRLTLEKLLDAV